MKIDLNCDLGEGIGNDEAIMPHITSANIACGFHAGDENIMQATVKLAKRYGVNIGAHPGWNDKQNFGRLEMNVPGEEVEAIVFKQINSLAQIAKAEGATLTHVKPHGALYNQAATDRRLADAIARAVKRFSAELILIGLAGSGLCEAGLEAGLKVASEGFPDRAYNPDGTLKSRSKPGAVIESPEDVAKNAVKLVGDGIMFGERRVFVDTLCLHGDNKRAAENAILLREVLTNNGIEIARL
ncbi:5-oxoprolinase subunit PxpA [Candidatus Villigracilis saccharophilus]|uniref:LamB/YcsF family protein n=1 Tax=Candidatus Villigracilis saccharophilus TaxID=3140684 RepID=UPI00313748AB|nr:LamB/YcsF family protein [Anaerolineales bacterium]